ncbi:MAG: tRNA 2-selenouridine synthase, partial [Planctomycetota bacterium]
MSVSSSRLPGDSKPKGDPRGPAVAIPSVTAEAVLEAADAQVIDLRSPAEFALDHLPGARNVPLFDDLERALIGTLYSRSSPQEAFDEGIQRTRQRVADLTAEIARLAEWTPPGEDLDGLVQRMAAGGIEAMQGALTLVPATLPKRSIVLHCWRGGMRSRSVVALLRNLGLERARLLEGGYKSYRKHVNGSISDWASPPSYVLRGFTGVGKTLVLRALEELCPGWTLDLEGAAGHRSSILGMVGLVPVPQKLFETRLALRLRSGFPSDLVVYEGESRKVGDAIIPETIWRSLRGGTPLDLYAPMAKRVEVLVADYL